MMSQLIGDPSCTTQSPVTTTKTFPTTLSVFRTETDTSELVNCSFVCFYSPTIPQHGNEATPQSLAWEQGCLTITGMGTRPPHKHWHGNEAALQSLAWERGHLTITGMGTRLPYNHWHGNNYHMEWNTIYIDQFLASQTVLLTTRFDHRPTLGGKERERRAGRKEEREKNSLSKAPSGSKYTSLLFCPHMLPQQQLQCGSA